MATIRTIADCVELAAKTARFYQRRLNRLLGVGVVNKPARHVNVSRPWDVAVCKAKRDVASNLARRMQRCMARGWRRAKR